MHRQAKKKGIIVLIFSFRLFVAAASIASTITYGRFFSQQSSLSIGIARTVVWQEVQLALSLMTASIPCLKSFLDAFTSTGLLTVHGRNMIAYRPPMRTVSSSDRSQATKIHTRLWPWIYPRGSSTMQRRLRPDAVEYEADVQAYQPPNDKAENAPSLQRTAESIESFDSERLTIHRSVEVQVRHS